MVQEPFFYESKIAVRSLLEEIAQDERYRSFAWQIFAELGEGVVGFCHPRFGEVELLFSLDEGKPSSSTVEASIRCQIDISKADYQPKQGEDPAWTREVRLAAAAMELNEVVDRVRDAVVIASGGTCLAERQLVSPLSEHVMVSTVNGAVHHAPYGTAEGYELSVERSWPPIEILHLLPVVRWVLRQPGLVLGRSTSKVERAVLCLDRAVSSESPMDLFWYVTGLEAIFNEGKAAGVVGPLTRNMLAHLGEPKSFKKMFTLMYEQRSLLIHGSMEICSAEQERSMSDGSLLEEINVPTAVAGALLVSTLQELFRRNATVVSFGIVPYYSAD